MPKASIEYPDDIVTKNKNGGWHPKGKRAYRNAVQTIMACLLFYKEPRLYHLCFEGQTHKKQMKMLNALVQMADRAGIKLEWFACREVADKTKKAHIHAFIVIDAYGINPYSVFNQFDDGQIGKLCIKHEINFSIFSPKDDLGIHGHTDYIALPYQGKGNRQTPRGAERLKDALRWLAYCFKARSKPLEEEADGQIFPASRPNRNKKPFPPSAPQAEKEEAAPIPTLKKEIQNAEQFETQPTTSTAERVLDSTGRKSSSTEAKDSMQLTTAGFNYLGGIYESCVDQGLNILDIQRHLNNKGISRSLRQVRHDLDNVFVFPGYVETHPAPPMPDLVKFDAAVNATRLTRSDSRLNRVYSRELSKLSHYPSSIGLTVSEPPGIIEPLTQMSQFRSYPE